MNTLQSPLTFKNPRIEEYRRLIRAYEHNFLKRMDELFCNNLYNEFVKCSYKEATKQFFKSKLEGHFLVDPGCGLATGYMITVAKTLGASQYLGIDRRVEQSTPLDENPPLIWKFNQDMLEVIAQLETGSANFTINGIDGDVLGLARDKSNTARPYVTSLAEEIARVTKKNGLVFGIFSHPIARELESQHGFHSLNLAELNLISSYFVLEKRT